MQTRNTVLCFFFLLLALNGVAQTKRALLIGINNYYKKDASTGAIVQDKINSLHGCVNDARSVRELLSSRFGYKSANITELYNEPATKEGILQALEKLLAASKPGDYVFFYYSGHGIQLKNPKTKSTDEAIAPNDALYIKNGFIKTLELAALFNKFVDKKVILTTLFDCCHSWGTHLDMGRNQVKSDFTFTTSINTPGREEAFPGDRTDEDYMVNPSDFSVTRISKEISFDDYLDTGNYDTGDLYECNPADSSFYLFNLGFYLFRSSDTLPALFVKDTINGKFVPVSQTLTNEREFTLQWLLTGETTVAQEIPSQRPQSNYLFLSATNDDQKALERMDEVQIKHGVFTKALIEVFKKNRAITAAAALYEKIQQELKKRYISQTPILKCDPQRLQKNLLGVPAKTVSSLLLTKCLQSDASSVLLDKGALAGLLPGNTLQDVLNAENVVAITSVNENNTAIAKRIKGNANLKGHTFKVVNWYSKTDPLLKVYLPAEQYSFDRLQSFIDQQIQPLIKEQDKNGFYKGYGYYVPFEEQFACKRIFATRKGIVYRDSSSGEMVQLQNLDTASIRRWNRDRPYIVYMPVPDEIVQQLKLSLKADQNIVLVDNPKDAEVTLHCFYSRNINKDKDYLPGTKRIDPVSPYYRTGLAPAIKEGEVPDVNILLALENETVGNNQDSDIHTPGQPFLVLRKSDKNSLSSISDKLYNWLRIRAAQKGIWLNDWPRK